MAPGAVELINAVSVAMLSEATIGELRVIYDLRQAPCDLLTLGQYLQPTDGQLPVDRFVPPAKFAGYQAKAEGMGFRCGCGSSGAQLPAGRALVAKDGV